MSSREASSIPFQMIKAITDDFSETKKIGSGGYGEVYRGLLNGDEVAVKKLFPVNGIDDVEFSNEFSNLMKVQHKNIIRLLHYSYEKLHRQTEQDGKIYFSEVTDRALCFEYMPLGSLSKHISDESCQYDWPTTYKIIKGTCEGLHHLHKGRGVKNYIYHLDLKPDNILLDENLVPKIGDFGLSRLFGDSKTHETSKTKGTIGFMPPEYINYAKVTPKNDVFSLGVIIFYILVGRKGYDDYSDALRCRNYSPHICQGFIESVKDYWKKKKEATVGYRWDKTDILGITKCVEIAISCVHAERDSRPSTMEIIDNLNKLDAQIEEMLKNDLKPLPLIGVESSHIVMETIKEKMSLAGSGKGNRTMEQQNVLERILEGTMKPTHLPLETLQKITEDFSVDRIIGEGGFGKVYKGVVGNKNVAVKRIRSSMTINQKLFRREVDSQMDVSHENIVRFLGLCSHTVETPMENPEAQGRYIYAEIRERLLCFEFVSNGSLNKYITDELRGLEWGTRYQIIKGICAGLHYLHTEKHILHMDLKPANILLDNKMVPKITDFGLSRPMEISQTMTTHYFSSPGYGAPENLFGHGTMSVKSDMYSLGAIIIELVTGQKGIPDNNNNVLRRWRHSWNKSAKETPLEYHHQVIECIEIGKLCLNLDPHTRPSMSQVMNKFVEMESIKINPIHWEDDMLGVEPLELQFRFNKEQKLSCSVELGNDTDCYIAFKIETTSPLPYSIEPNKDIVKPRSKFSVDIKLPFSSIQDYKAALQYSSSNQRYSKELIVQSFKVNEGLTTKHINKNMFDKHTEGHHVDEIHLVVVWEESYSEEAFLEKNNSIQTSLLPEKMSSNVAMIPLHLIKNITDEFAEKNRLGKGSSGEVYKGVLNGQEIAVKMLFPVHGLDVEKFTNEFHNLMKVQHKNIVRLIGYYYEIAHQHINHNVVFSKVIDRALCFEFMGQGSLSQHLSADSCIHDWPTTFKIIKGTSEGIDYLHRGRGENNCIYHLDLKPDKILMDKYMVPKIGVFGSSRLFNDSETHQTTTAKGTIGFMPPEFISNGIVTPKNDVFSLGVIIFHLMAGEKGYNDYCDLRLRRELLENREQFIGGVQEYWKKTMQRTVGYTLTGTDLLGVRACLQMAMRCVDDDRDKRPSTREIISDLSKLNDQIEKMPTIVQTPTRSNRREKLDVVIVYAFDCTDDSTPAWYTVGDVYAMVQGKLLANSESSIGFTYVMLTPNTCTSDMNLVSSTMTGYEKSSAWSRTTCVKNMACGLLEAHKLISYLAHWNSLILLFSDGLINKGDFFDGAEDYISEVPVHTFTLGGDAYNHGLRSMAANSPGGKFHNTQVPDKPILSETFSQLLDSIIGDAMKTS